jgi:hypothetical protein
MRPGAPTPDLPPAHPDIPTAHYLFADAVDNAVTHTSRIYLAHIAGNYLLSCASSWNLVRPSVVGSGCCNPDTLSGCAVPPSAPALAAAGMQTDGGLGKHSVLPCRVSDATNTAFRLETTSSCLNSRCAAAGDRHHCASALARQYHLRR